MEKFIIFQMPKFAQTYVTISRLTWTYFYNLELSFNWTARYVLKACLGWEKKSCKKQTTKFVWEVAIIQSETFSAPLKKVFCTSEKNIEVKSSQNRAKSTLAKIMWRKSNKRIFSEKINISGPVCNLSIYRQEEQKIVQTKV